MWEVKVWGGKWYIADNNGEVRFYTNGSSTTLAVRYYGTVSMLSYHEACIICDQLNVRDYGRVDP